MDELLNPETDERLVLYVCMIPVQYALVSIRGSAVDIASLRLDGEKVRELGTGLAKMLADRMFVTSVLKPLMTCWGCLYQ